MTNRIAVIVTGDRHATADDWEGIVKDAIRPYEDGGERILIHGDAPGIDAIAAAVGGHRCWTVLPMPAQWGSLGRRAGPVRNGNMLDALCALRECGYRVLCLGFHDDIGSSKGTKNMIGLAAKFGVETWLIGSDRSRTRIDR